MNDNYLSYGDKMITHIVEIVVKVKVNYYLLFVKVKNILLIRCNVENVGIKNKSPDYRKS